MPLVSGNSCPCYGMTCTFPSPADSYNLGYLLLSILSSLATCSFFSKTGIQRLSWWKAPFQTLLVSKWPDPEWPSWFRPLPPMCLLVEGRNAAALPSWGSLLFPVHLGSWGESLNGASVSAAWARTRRLWESIGHSLFCYNIPRWPGPFCGMMTSQFVSPALSPDSHAQMFTLHRTWMSQKHPKCIF